MKCWSIAKKGLKSVTITPTLLYSNTPKPAWVHWCNAIRDYLLWDDEMKLYGVRGL